MLPLSKQPHPKTPQWTITHPQTPNALGNSQVAAFDVVLLWDNTTSSYLENIFAAGFSVQPGDGPDAMTIRYTQYPDP